MRYLAGYMVPLLLVSPVTAHGSNEEVPVLVVRGDAELFAAPDMAIVRLGVEAQAETATAAQQSANRTGAAIYRALQGAGVSEEALQTTGLSLSPIYARPDERGGERRVVAYRAQNLVTARVADVAEVGAVVDAGLAAGANRVDGIQFSLEDDTEVRNRALGQAIAEARSKAEALAQALGVRLASIHGVQERQVTVEPFHARADMVAMAAEAAPTPIAAGEVGVRAQVTVQYRMSGTELD